MSHCELICHSRFQIFGAKHPFTLLFFTGRDGYLRIIDYSDFHPILLFQITTGGIQTFTINRNYDMIILACEDNSAILLSLENLNLVRIIGHQSFLTDAKLICLSEIIECQLANNLYDEVEEVYEEKEKIQQKENYNEIILVITCAMDQQVGLTCIQ
eukprot:TRINITY_DN41100_c0_g1_i1.p8 TRINITY_DN41100_c0_g1~~TRINITY_DN41100_c0_g1_i1.p8  ORF type:complete len:157 (-),score=28.53 TRINITY_DN41100_c0_g1_i1:351-821(-)